MVHEKSEQHPREGNIKHRIINLPDSVLWTRQNFDTLIKTPGERPTAVALE